MGSIELAQELLQEPDGNRSIGDYIAYVSYPDRINRSDFYDREDPYGTKQHVPTRPVDKDKAESELTLTIKKATNPDETAPKQKHVRKCIVYSWDYHDSQSIWAGLRVQPILADEVQTFKALITVHKILQEGHPIVLKQAQQQTGWLETCARTVGNDGRGYTPLIKAYVSSLLAKLRFHKTHPDFNGLFEYEEYVTLKGIDDPNEGYETISDLMNLQDQIDSFQKLIFAHFRGSTNNECRISALVPQVKESYGIYRFITSMLRAMHRRTDAADALEPLRQRYNSQHYNLRKFYYECSNLKYLTGLINVPKLPQEPPNLFDSSSLPDLPARPKTVAPPPASPPPPRGEPTPDIDEQRRMLKHYEDQQAALKKKQEEERRKAEEEKARFDAMRREQEERERMERERMEQLRREQEEERRRMEMQMQMGRDQQALMRVQELEREMMGMRGQYERDQMMLEQYDRRVKALEQELMNYNANLSAQLSSKDELIKQLQEQVALWKNKYEALAKLYSQLRTEHLDMLSKFKQFQLKANSAQEAIERMERMERDMKAKNLELADMIRERDRARFESDRLKSSHKDELESLGRLLAIVEASGSGVTGKVRVGPEVRGVTRNCLSKRTQSRRDGVGVRRHCDTRRRDTRPCPINARTIGGVKEVGRGSFPSSVASGRGSGSTQAFYKRNNRWTEGLISAAKAVAWATTNLIQTADGVIDGSKSLEQLIVASNEVAASTAQLVQASRVKSDLMSKTQEKLELAAKAVQDACKALVKQVKAITSKQMLGRDDADYNSMGAHEFKMREMEVQVSIVTLEKELGDARRKLGEMRRAAYHTDESI
ncbi:ANTH-domain-containing protein [Atractiella rhizophila]|nr:ANTH-domain-containing protein [Atractiella rhizophila]